MNTRVCFCRSDIQVCFFVGNGILVLIDLFLATQISYLLLKWASVIIAVALLLGAFIQPDFRP